MTFNKFIEKLKSNPKTLFLFDGLGAALTAFMLGFVLVKLEAIFRIPTPTLYVLAVIPVLYVAYDLFCYLTTNHKRPQFLKGIAILNVLYCVLSIGFAIYHSSVISVWAWMYIVIEIVIILVLVSIEFKVARQLH